VLCEKPFTANADEAREIAELAAKSDRVVMEAFHYRYRPLASRIEEIVAADVLLGDVLLHPRGDVAQAKLHDPQIGRAMAVVCTKYHAH
jgi:predicted dehydrogenase